MRKAIFEVAVVRHGLVVVPSTKDKGFGACVGLLVLLHLKHLKPESTLGRIRAPDIPSLISIICKHLCSACTRQHMLSTCEHTHAWPTAQITNLYAVFALSSGHHSMLVQPLLMDMLSKMHMLVCIRAYQSGSQKLSARIREVSVWCIYKGKAAVG